MCVVSGASAAGMAPAEQDGRSIWCSRGRRLHRVAAGGAVASRPARISSAAGGSDGVLSEIADAVSGVVAPTRCPAPTMSVTASSTPRSPLDADEAVQQILEAVSVALDRRGFDAVCAYVQRSRDDAGSPPLANVVELASAAAAGSAGAVRCVAPRQRAKRLHGADAQNHQRRRRPMRVRVVRHRRRRSAHRPAGCVPDGA